MAVQWTFKCYVSPTGIDEIRAAYDKEGKQTKSKFLSRLKALHRMPFNEWTNGGMLAKDLHGPCKGLTEIKFVADKLQQRPLGFRSGESEFTIVFWEHEKGGKWVDRNTCSKATERKNEIVKNGNAAHDLWLVLE